MKLDVEGREYDIVPHLVRTQAMCALHMAFLEWHPKVISWQEHRKGLNAVERMIRAERQVAEELSRTSHHCAVNLTDLDDETFTTDGRPCPMASLCRTFDHRRKALPQPTGKRDALALPRRWRDRFPHPQYGIKEL